MKESLRRYGSSVFRAPISAAYPGSSRSSLASDASSSAATVTNERAAAISTASARTSSRYRASASVRARSSASSIEAGPALGLPSMSPPTHVPNARGGGAPGRRSRQTRNNSVAASSRLCSKNQSAWRISSEIRRRSCRTSSVCQRSVTSSAMRSSACARSAGETRGSSRTTSCSWIRMCASSTLRRVVSVGCAVSTSWIDVSLARAASSSAGRSPSSAKAASRESCRMRPSCASSRRRRRR